MTSPNDRPAAPRRPHAGSGHHEPRPAPQLAAERKRTADDQATSTEEVHSKLAEADDRYLRLAADFENLKRRKSQELLDSSRYASEEAARAMLPVLDNLRRAVEHAPEGGAEEFFVNGLELVVREFETALERLGVTRVPSVGEPFDPAVHDAIGGEESADVERDTVSEELVPGYRLHDRLLRPAMVRVAHPRSASAAP